jgi:hypothetical protein
LAAPTLIFVETNGTPPGTTTPASPITGVSVGVATIVYANVDTASPSLTAGPSNGVPAGARSYEKWWQIGVTAVATTTIGSLGISYSATLPIDALGSSATVALYASTALGPTYQAPTNLPSIFATTLASTLTVLGSVPLTAPGNVVGGLSSYFVSQLALTGAVAPGALTFGNPLVTLQYTWS